MMEDMFTYIWNRIGELCERKGCTQQELSRAVGYDKSYLSSMKSQKSIPPYTTLKKMCDYFGIVMADFFNPYFTGLVSADMVLIQLKNLFEDEDYTKLSAILAGMKKEDAKAWISQIDLIYRQLKSLE